MRNLVAALIALAAAALFGLGNALEHREVQAVAEPDGVRLTLLARLARRRRWVIGMVCDASAYAMTAVALSLGALLAVAPMLPMNLLFAMPLSAHWSGRKLRPRQIVWAVVLCASVGLFLAVGAPRRGNSSASFRSWIPVLVAVGSVVFIAIVRSRHTSGGRRAVWLGVASGLCLGASSALTKTFVHLLGHGMIAVVTHWEPYGLAVTSLGGLLLIQSMFQRAELSAGLPANEMIEPLLGSVIGVFLFKESIHATSTFDKVLVGTLIAAMLISVVALARDARVLLEPPSPGPATSSSPSVRP